MRRRRSRVAVVIVGLALASAACGGSGTAPPSSPAGSATVAPSVAPSLSEPPVAGSFADLPFTLELPAGWVFGTQQQVEANLRSLEQSNPADAQKYEALLAQAAPATSSFVAYDVKSTESVPPSMSCRTEDLGTTSAADALNLGQIQNADAVAKLPGIVGKPTVDRVTLTVGETVRIRWRTTAPDGDTTSIGYFFVALPTAYTCVFTAATTTVGTHQSEWESILDTFHAKASAGPGATASSASALECPGAGTLPHQAPEIESLLPGIVQGRALSRWSVRGECWLETVITNAGVRGQLVAAATTASNPNPADPALLVYGVAGRADLADPPYFVYAAVRPQTNEEIELVMLLLLGGAGYKDVGGGIDLSRYHAETISGKQVDVGTAAMLDQTEHQRGSPYLYETDTHLFLLITADTAWAADAISQLP